MTIRKSQPDLGTSLRDRGRLEVEASVMAVYAVSLYRGQGVAEARALTYTTLIIANLCLILTNRSWSRTILETMSNPNPALWLVVRGALTFLAMVLYVPFLRELFGFAYLHFIDIAICLMAGITSTSGSRALRSSRQDKLTLSEPFFHQKDSISEFMVSYHLLAIYSKLEAAGAPMQPR